MILGDAWPLVTSLPEGQVFHERQPLTMALQQFLYQTLGGRGVIDATRGAEIARRTVALGSVAAGTLFAFVALAVGRLLARSENGRLAAVAPDSNGPKGQHTRSAGLEALLAALVLLSQGYCQLFFGYVENYAFPALFTGLYMFASFLVLMRRAPLLLSSTALASSIGLHFSSILLIPSFLFLVVVGFRTRPLATLRDLATFVLGLVALDFALRTMSRDFSIAAAARHILALGTSDQGGGGGLAYMMSARHVRDFFNAQWLIGPVAGSFLVPCVALILFARRFHPVALFSAIAGGAFLAGGWVMPDPALGYARDWDLFAPSGVAMCAAALAIFFHEVPGGPARLRLLFLLGVLSAANLAPWVAVNASDERSLARLKELPLGLGRTEVVVANWYRRQGRDDEAIEWFQRAMRVNPNNNNAYALLGTFYASQGRTDLAVDLLLKAVMLRPDKEIYRLHALQALVAEGRLAESLPHYEWLCRQDPTNFQRWLDYRGTLSQIGREMEARQVLRRALGVFEPLQRLNPGDYERNFQVGILYAGLERHLDALAHFQCALEIEPDSELALYNVASMLVSLDRKAEARPHLERILALTADPATRQQVLRWLRDAER
jgi:tetratricopeptide (TPR) repeat protein